MPYPVISDSTTKTMVTSWVALQKEIAEMKKDKKADKKKIAELEKQLDLKGQNITKKALADIGMARKSFVDHATKVDKWLGDCNQALKASKDAAAQMERTHSTNDMDKAGYAEGYIAEIAKMAKADNDELGASWFSYRGGIVDQIDKKYGDPMKAIRNEMIAAEKNIKNKILQMETLAQQAKAVKESAKRSLLGGLNFKEETQAEAAKVETDMKTQHDSVIKNVELVENKPDAMARAVAAAKEADKKGIAGVLSTAQTLAKESVKQLNDAKLTATAMSKALATQMKSFSAEDQKDPTIKTHLDRAKHLVDDAVARVKNALPVLQKLSTDLTQIETLAKNKK
ncbi:MAG: hypothetical protein ACTHN5_07565 [Phycisphaerae bacterium]